MSRVQFDGNTFGNTTPFPDIFADKTVSGIQASIHLDQYYPIPGFPRVSSLRLHGVTSNFAGRLEGVLMRSVDGQFLTYIGEAAPVGSNGTSTSYNVGPGTNLQGNTDPLYARVVALVDAAGNTTLNPEVNAYSGDVPRAALTINGEQLYLVGNADATLYDDGTGPGFTIGARYGMFGSDLTAVLGTYFASDRTDQPNTAAGHVKDNNFRAVGIYNGNLYIAKGSGGTGDNGLFQVHNGTGDGIPFGPNNVITQMFGGPATDPVTKAAGIYTPYGFWFANANTVYVADEGNVTFDKNNALVVDPLAGLQKWIKANGKWTLAYTLTAGLNLGGVENIDGYPYPTQTYGLRNMTGKLNPDGTATIFAVTGQYSAISNGTPDPNKLVAITDTVSATTLPAAERFTVLQYAEPGSAFRGVALAPTPASTK